MKNKKKKFEKMERILQAQGLHFAVKCAESSGLFNGLEDPDSKQKISNRDILMTELALLTMGVAKIQNVEMLHENPAAFKKILGITSDLPSEKTLKKHLKALGTSMDPSHILSSNIEMLKQNGMNIPEDEWVPLDVFAIPIDVSNKKSKNNKMHFLAVALVGKEHFLCNLELYHSMKEFDNGVKNFIFETMKIVTELTDHPLIRIFYTDRLPIMMVDFYRQTGKFVEAIMDCWDNKPEWEDIGRTIYVPVFGNENKVDGLCKDIPNDHYFWTNTLLPVDLILFHLYEHIISIESMSSIWKELFIGLGLGKLSNMETASNSLITKLAIMTSNILRLMDFMDGENFDKLIGEARKQLVSDVSK